MGTRTSVMPNVSWTDSSKVAFGNASSIAGRLSPMTRPRAVACLVTTMFLIRRGFCYVPVTFTGMAYLNFFRFRFFQKTAVTTPAAAE